MQKQKFIILVGNIGTGKTTYADNNFRIDSNFEIIRGDDYPKKFEEDGIGKMISDIEKILKSGKNIVIDGPHVKVCERKDLMFFAKGFDVDFIAIDFGKGSEESLSRRCNNPGYIDKMDWRRAHRVNCISYKKPTIDEGFSEIIEIRN